ncbi:hypothetical protein SteCoe_13933 [Stentor coeruleus]|uniref:Uncharacterized protein n=1 Tax=Stentor coeruleus TaxID=5963 RepID=A0A1R2C7G0_9CILI|nr:hypothetical protein SteCoe_13933 [Stentor coeruleus]
MSIQDNIGSVNSRKLNLHINTQLARNPFKIALNAVVPSEKEQNAFNPQEESKNSSSSDSSNESFDSPLDPEVLKIKGITSTLTSQITEKLMKYKSLRKTFDQQAEILKQQVQSLQEESKSLQSLNDLRHETTSINEKVKVIRDYMSLRNSRLPTEENQRESSVNQENLVCVLQNIQGELEVLKDKYEKIECSPVTQENIKEHLNYEESKYPRHSLLEMDEPKTVCACSVM